MSSNIVIIINLLINNLNINIWTLESAITGYVKKTLIMIISLWTLVLVYPCTGRPGRFPLGRCPLPKIFFFYQKKKLQTFLEIFDFFQDSGV